MPSVSVANTPKRVSFGAGIRCGSWVTMSNVDTIKEIVGAMTTENGPTASIIKDMYLGTIPIPVNHIELRQIVEAAKKLPHKVMLEITPDKDIVAAVEKVLNR